MTKKEPLAMSSHPMIPVPTAIEIVLTNIAEALLEGADGTIEEGTTEVLPVFCDPSCSQETPSSLIIGRRAAEKIVAPFPGHPPFHASIMDGYAICTNSVLLENERLEDVISFRVVGSVYAGPYQPSMSHRDEDVRGEPLGNTAIYVTTGGVVPFPYDCVVPVEDAILTENDQNHQRYISVTAKLVQSMKWIRPVGCDIPPNTVLVDEGDVLSCVDLGVLVTFGITHIRVLKEPKVGVLSTGNELKVLSAKCNQHNNEPQFPPNKEGLIYDVNRPVLLSLLATESHVRPIDYGIALDDIDFLERRIRCALEECDVLITSGGISTGDKDLLENLLTETIGAKLHFGRLNMKPGKPTTFFTWRNPKRHKSQTKFIFALPGNPVSAFVCFNLIVSPALNLLHSQLRFQNEHYVSRIHASSLVDTIVQNSLVHNEVTAVITQKLPLDEERPEYHRVLLSWDASNSVFVATSTGVQRSSRFLSLKGADGLLVLPQGIPGGKMCCYPGEKHLCLLLNGQNNNWNSSRGIKWKDSLHKVAFDATPSLQHQKTAQQSGSNILVEIFCVGAASDASFIEKIIAESLASTESTSNYEIRQPRLFASSESFLKALDNFSDMTDPTTVNLWIIASDCRFKEQVKFSSLLRSFLERRSDAMAMVARKKMAEECALSALFEVVVGWYKKKLIVCLPQSGIGSSLRSLEPLIAHALLLNMSA